MGTRVTFLRLATDSPSAPTQPAAPPWRLFPWWWCPTNFVLQAPRLKCQTSNRITWCFKPNYLNTDCHTLQVPSLTVRTVTVNTYPDRFPACSDVWSRSALGFSMRAACWDNLTSWAWVSASKEPWSTWRPWPPHAIHELPTDSRLILYAAIRVAWSILHYCMLHHVTASMQGENTSLQRSGCKQVAWPLWQCRHISMAVDCLDQNCVCLFPGIKFHLCLLHRSTSRNGSMPHGKHVFSVEKTLVVSSLQRVMESEHLTKLSKIPVGLKLILLRPGARPRRGSALLTPQGGHAPAWRVWRASPSLRAAAPAGKRW